MERSGVERAKRSGGLHKRSAEDWGNGLRARGAELPLGDLAVAFRVGVAGRNEVVTKLSSLGGTTVPLFRGTASKSGNCAFCECAFSAVAKHFRQPACPEHIRDAFQVVSHRGNADFDSRTG